MKNLLFAVLLTFSHAEIYGATIVALANEKTPMPINSELGSIVQFPKPIKTVTPAKYFQISDVSAAESLQKLDVKTFQIKPIPGSRTEEVVFVQNDGHPITLQLMPTQGAPKFYEIQLDSGMQKSKSSKFLIQELAMMQAMLRDEPGGFGREVLDRSIETGIEGLGFRLRRVFSAALFTGYVFTVRNTGSAAAAINVAAISFGSPNRAILGQVDSESLVPCPLISLVPACETALRVILHGQKTETPILGQIFKGIAPFMPQTTGTEGSTP